MIQFFSKKMNKKRKGFTLIELIVVIAILGILAALAIPRFTSARDSAAETALRADARSIQSEMEVIYAENGSYTVAGTATADYDTIGLQGTYSGTISYTGDETTYDIKYTQGTRSITFDETTNDIATITLGN